MNLRDKCTEEMRNVLEDAKSEAALNGLRFAHSGHLLISSVKVDSAAKNLLNIEFFIGSDILREALDSYENRRDISKPLDSGVVVYSKLALSLLDMAIIEADHQERSLVGSDSLILAMLKEPTNLAGIVLREVNNQITYEAVRRILTSPESRKDYDKFYA